MVASHFKKSTAPVTGDKYGSWGPDSAYYARLPGGSVLTFDLSRLTLGDYRQMRDDYQLSASLNVLTFIIAQADWSLDCEDPKIAEALEVGIRNYWFPLIKALSTAFWSGYAPIVKVFELNNTSKQYEVVQYKDLLPENSRVHWKTSKGAGGKGTIYNYDGITDGNHDPIPAEQTLWYPMLMEHGNYYGRKLLRPAFPAWFFSQLMHLFTNRYFERFGEPTAVGYYPPDDTVTQNDGTTISARSAMEGVLSNLRSRGVVTMPSGRDETGNPEWDIKYLESQMRGVDFDRYIARLDEEKSLALFTPVLLFRSGERGSYNLGTQQVQVFHWMLNSLLGDIGFYLNKYLLKHLKDINYGPNAPAVTFRFRTLGRLTDEGAQSTLLGLIQNGGAKLNPTGLQDLGDYLGLGLEEVQQLSPDAAAPPAAAPPQAGRDPRLHPGPQESRVASILGGATGNPRQPLLAARKRLEEQVAKYFAQKSGSDLEHALSHVKVGFKGAFLNEMQDCGATVEQADTFFSSLEHGLRSGLETKRTLEDAVEAIDTVYADLGVTADE